ncbi:MAG TPA: SUMF1/EgtB/PvdO family nonheme iron enzyme, partial [Sorangium sp.]|nr:SUMF1/EgtB/PvdO family nonheme iron enzyme [Sorangium sp.]
GTGGAEPVAAPSCRSGEPGVEALCGPERISSCCDSKLVPGGTFKRHFDGVVHTDDSYPATVSSFLLDTYEVTVGRFRAFVDAGQGTQASAPDAGAGEHSKIPGSGWDGYWNDWLEEDTAALRAALRCDPVLATWTDDVGPNEDLPMNCIKWAEAFAFCAWDRGRLPTLAELNYAAAGGDEQREYPWGQGIDLDHVSYGCLGDGSPEGECALSDIFPVGSKPMGAGRWGHQDLAGGVKEFVRDWSGSMPVPCVDCAVVEEPTVAGYVYTQGGSYLEGAPRQRVAAGGINRISARYDLGVGFRCARNPPSTE